MKFTFYTKYFSFLLVCILFVSCSKDNTNGEGDSYIRFTFNGEKLEYRSFPSVAISSDDDPKLMTLVAYKNFKANDLTGFQEHISLLVHSETDFATGVTYEDHKKVIIGGAKFPQLLITHYDKNKEGFQSVGIYADENGVVRLGWGGVGTALSNVANGKIVFSEISDTRIKGSFSGTLYIPENWINGTPYPIVNGEFSIRRY